MFLNDDNKLEFSFKLIAGAFVTAFLLFYLTEFIYFDAQTSFFVNSIFFITILITILKNKIFGICLLLFSYASIYTRPRALHTISIDDRGQYDFFSFHSQSLGPFVFSTTLLLVISLYTFYLFITKTNVVNFKNLYPILALALLYLVSPISFIFEGNPIYLNDFVTDFKNVILLTSGFILGHFAYQENKNSFFNYLINMLLFLLLVSAFFSYSAVLYDYSQNEFVLKYGLNTYITAPIFFLCFLIPSKSNQSFLISSIIAFCCFSLWPFTRGEQLNFMILFLITAYFIFQKTNITNTVRRLGFLFFLSIFFYQTELTNLFTTTLDTSISFYLRKVSLFLEGTIDKSVNVRLAEFGSIFVFNNLVDYYQFLFGSGLGSYFSLDISALHTLDYTDFSEQSLLNNRFLSPHSFIAYYILKVGIVGIAFICYFFFKAFSQVTQNTSLNKLGINLYTLFVFSFLWNGYWVPMISFFGPFYVGALNSKYNDEK
tara:strand:- start:5593 stop:7053 length:1461 start_codon:yes stop_codon:yes gene_type:complete